MESLNDAKFWRLEIGNKAPKVAVEGSLDVHKKTKTVSHQISWEEKTVTVVVFKRLKKEENLNRCCSIAVDPTNPGEMAPRGEFVLGVTDGLERMPS
ncbi:unnamed protein product [Sphenostylis stenocarpa]|uniref:Uncharacterized protein n=1 Tax=Sphenostylis stenocarpa TaxID=92480 RepID=A0AA86T318_9FABA|nr:unnamed protein product [Sphenostylis stenocarpa]